MKAIRDRGWYGGMAAGQDMSGEYYGIPGRYWFGKVLTPARFTYITTCRVELHRRYQKKAGWNWHAFLLVKGRQVLDAYGKSRTLLEAIETIDPCLDDRTVACAIRAYMRQQRCSLRSAETGEELFGVYVLSPETPIPCGRYHYLRHEDGFTGEFILNPWSCSIGPIRSPSSAVGQS